MARKRLGDLLVDKKIINQAQLTEALHKQKELNLRLGETLVISGYASEEDIARVLSSQLGYPFLRLRDINFSENAVNLISRALAVRYNVVPIETTNGILRVGMSDPMDVLALDDIEFMTNMKVEPIVMTDKDINRAIEWVYDTPQYFYNNEKNGQDDLDLEELAKDAPLVRLVNSIISQAVEDAASDVHVEPDDNRLTVRYRIDGQLQPMRELESDIHLAFISRLKILANLDISERRLPQDGSFRQLVNTSFVDIRLSTLPTLDGEKAVLRIHDSSQGTLDLNSLGFNKTMEEQLAELLHLPYGMLLVTGPTGSGKTTTLYAFLDILNHPNKNIVTIEDPAEYRFNGINQVNVNAKIGLSFARVLRSVLRQDPNIIMLGEIRDHETAEIAVRAALTGHLVLSTLHTNNAAGALTRLTDMEVAPFLTSSAVAGVLAQRLLRKVCLNCREEYQLSVNSKLGQALGLGEILSEQDEVTLFKAGKGCSMCHRTGYKGRTGVFELLLVDETVSKMIIDKQSTSAIENYAVTQGMQLLRQDAIAKLLQGVTTAEEVLSVVLPQVHSRRSR